MAEWEPTQDELSGIYAMFWRLVQIMVHRYGSFPTAHLLTMLTIVLLDRAGYHPTVGELADITKLPKSSVSRYVATDMNSGFIEEIIDPNDRRRRRLHPTLKSKEEQEWQLEKILEVLDKSTQAYGGYGKTENPAEDLKRMLQGIGESD
jgi:DNA-binding MarR family transcriptional regulator